MAVGLSLIGMVTLLNNMTGEYGFSEGSGEGRLAAVVNVHLCVLQCATHVCLEGFCQGVSSP